MNLIDVKRLDPETTERLKSDFWHIVKMIQESSRSDYEPDDTRPIRHEDEVSEFMSEYTGINYSSAVQSLRKRRKKITMKSLLSEAEKKEIREKTTEEVTAEVTVKNSAAIVLTVMKKLNTTADEAIAFLNIPAELPVAVLEEVKKLS